MQRLYILEWASQSLCSCCQLNTWKFVLWLCLMDCYGQDKMSCPVQLQDTLTIQWSSHLATDLLHCSSSCTSESVNLRVLASWLITTLNFIFCVLNFRGWSWPRNYFNSEIFPIYGMPTSTEETQLLPHMHVNKLTNAKHLKQFPLSLLAVL